ncbi:hypothetical protein F4803DRAFT_519432 [Xylaria telfairii]|nr:hypothetical protein F4803DRAFT_519432 [Xylaria telfairii]
MAMLALIRYTVQRRGSSPLATPPGWRWGSWLTSSPLLDGSDLLVELSQELFVGPVLATLVVDGISSGDSASRPSEIHLDPSPAAQQPCQIHLTIASRAWSNVPELTVHCRMPRLVRGCLLSMSPALDNCWPIECATSLNPLWMQARSPNGVVYGQLCSPELQLADGRRSERQPMHAISQGPG